jgi:hypothetical protein
MYAWLFSSSMTQNPSLSESSMVTMLMEPMGLFSGLLLMLMLVLACAA